MLTCTHSYSPTVYRTLPGWFICGCQILDIFWPPGRGRLICRSTSMRVYTVLTSSIIRHLKDLPLFHSMRQLNKQGIPTQINTNSFSRCNSTSEQSQNMLTNSTYLHVKVRQRHDQRRHTVQQSCQEQTKRDFAYVYFADIFKTSDKSFFIDSSSVAW